MGVDSSVDRTACMDFMRFATTTHDRIHCLVTLQTLKTNTKKARQRFFLTQLVFIIHTNPKTR